MLAILFVSGKAFLLFIFRSLKYVENRNVVNVSLSQLYYDTINKQLIKYQGKDNMNFIEITLSNKIKEVEPTLDVLRADRKVLQVAVQDFTNYLNFYRNLENKETNILYQVKQMEQLQKEEPTEFDSSLAVWSSVWLRKWKERVNLSFGKQNPKATENDCKSESLWTKLECREEIIRIVASSLIRNAEICGTQIIAENIIKKESCKCSSEDINSKEQVLKILSNSLRRARETTQKIGPLIALQVDKRYYCEVNN